MIYEPFSKATLDVFKLLLDLDIFSSIDDAEGAKDGDNKVSIIIDIIGDLKGSIIYRFPVETTLEMVKIMSGMEFDEVDEFVTSALGEIANIISGNAMTNLTEQKIVCDILPPRVVSGESQLCQDDCSSVTYAKVDTTIGVVELLIKIQ
jgi:chemotaxis protein CheX